MLSDLECVLIKHLQVTSRVPSHQLRVDVCSTRRTCLATLGGVVVVPGSESLFVLMVVAGAQTCLSSLGSDPVDLCHTLHTK